MKKTKPDNMLSANETLDKIGKQWATVYDIMEIGFVGDTKARNIAKEIRENMTKKTPRGLVPMEEVVKYFNININYLKKIKG